MGAPLAVHHLSMPVSHGQILVNDPEKGDIAGLEDAMDDGVDSGRFVGSASGIIILIMTPAADSSGTPVYRLFRRRHDRPDPTRAASPTHLRPLRHRRRQQYRPPPSSDLAAEQGCPTAAAAVLAALAAARTMTASQRRLASTVILAPSR
jgi:hypothetical protein